jgi:methylphosphotriester-DNA--protein-cysteine methyltransferase
VTIDCWIAAAVETSSTRGRKASLLVQQAEALALASVDEPLHVTALCSIIGVSERTLRKAFHRVHGTPPTRMLRLISVALRREEAQQPKPAALPTAHRQQPNSATKSAESGGQPGLLDHLVRAGRIQRGFGSV